MVVVATLLAVVHIPQVEGDNHLVVGHIPRAEEGSLLEEGDNPLVVGGIPLVEGGSCTARGARIRTL